VSGPAWAVDLALELRDLSPAVEFGRGAVWVSVPVGLRESLVVERDGDGFWVYHQSWNAAGDPAWRELWNAAGDPAWRELWNGADRDALAGKVRELFGTMTDG
jgi:hypothetical protein